MTNRNQLEAALVDLIAICDRYPDDSHAQQVRAQAVRRLQELRGTEGGTPST